jgi:hypothetical protein
MSGTSARTFEFVKAVQAKCSDWSEFDQVSYIKEGLHNSQGGKSVYADGVCAGLCVYVLSDWLANGTRKDPVDRLVMDCNEQNTTRPSLEIVEALSHQFDKSTDDGRDAAIKAIKRIAKRDPKGIDFKIKPGPAIDATVGLGPTFLAWGGRVKTGHAVLCDGSKFVFFDPNYGYYKGKGKAEYTAAFKLAMSKYSEYVQCAAVTIFSF